MSNKVNKIKDDNIKLSHLKSNPTSDIYYKKGNIGKFLIEAAENKNNQGILFINNDYGELYLSYKEILDKAYLALGTLQKAGVKSGQYVMFMIDENVDFVINFWACVLGGIIPVPLTHPSSFTKGNAIFDKMIKIWNSLEKPAIIVDEKMKDNYDSFKASSDIKDMRILGTEEVVKSDIKGKLNLANVESPAFIQFSSGTTNNPKGVILTHENILINTEAIISALNLSSKDIILNWMPFSHNMGLIGFHIVQIANAAKVINMPAIMFIKKPTLWMDLVSKHKVTMTCSPNFGYKLLLQGITEKHIKSWDLSSLRIIINGAEPISIPLVNKFLDRLQCCGLKKSSMNLAYGMAEASLCITLSPVEAEHLSHCISHRKMVSDKIIEKIQESNKDSLLLADVGCLVAGMELRIVDSHGNVVPEKTIGEIQIKGRNITKGYLNNSQLTNELFEDGWLKTGDMGFVIDGRLSITGRMKDIIFVNGQNFYAHDIEARIEGLDGVEPGKIAVCGWLDEKENKEKVALFSNLSVKREFYSKILSFISEVIGMNIDYVVLVDSIPKTSSGKIQRFALMKAFQNNEYVNSVYPAYKLMIAKDENQDENQDENYEKILEEDKKVVIDKDYYLEKIQSIWTKVLELPKEAICYDRPFLALGGNSIKAIQMLSYLEDEFNITLSHDILINCRTINEMKDYLLEYYNKKLPEFNEAVITENLKESLKSKDNASSDIGDIAVISMACRFPGANNLDEFWENLVEGKSNITEVPNNRWDVNQYYSSNKILGKTYCKTGAFLDNPYSFDSEFYNIPEEEAEIMDPQQRIILELVYEALENAGYSKKHVDGKNVGIFIGASINGYYEYHLNTLNMNNIKEFNSFMTLSEEQKNSFIEEWKSRFGFTENHPNLLVDNILNMIAARASHEFNFKGPSLILDTACSSSLVTLHLASEAIRRGECEMAFAGGINLLLTPTPYIFFSSAGALSQAGESKVFDAEADGFVPGEGAGLVMLKPLEKALADNDEILAVIKGSAVNNDGHSIGVMAPNPDGQRSVIEALYAKHNIDPSEIQYVEAHGTGTKIGDPSEVRALAQAFSNWKPKNESIAIGSVKSNIGHLLNAAGIASFIKIVLALKNKKMPPNVNLRTPNPMIKFNKTPFYLINQAKNWQINEEGKRRAAINSFGFGGTNCHMLVQEAPVKENKISNNKSMRQKHVLALTAHTQEALKQKAINLCEFLEEHKDYSLGDICYTENIKTTKFKHRLAIVSSSIDELIEKLKKIVLKDTLSEASPNIAFMFTGQGCQYVGMARELYNELPEFKEYIDQCSEAFYPYINEKITDLIFGEGAEEKILAQTNITQPVVFTLDYVLGKLLMDWGVKPDCVLGHSVGEWAAACVAGVVTLEDAARLVSARGRLMNDLKSSGAMAAVFTSGNSVEELIKDFNKDVWIAAYNGNHQVVSGRKEHIDEFISLLEKKGIVCKELKVSQAFHTPLMEPMLEKFKKEMEGVEFNSPKIPIVSNITAEFIDKPLDEEYWLQHILRPVKFEQSIRFIQSKGINIFVEAGPDKILTGMAMPILLKSKANVLPMLDRKRGNWEVFLGTIGKLYCLGAKFNWEAFEKNFEYNRVKLPNYPFQRKDYGPKFGNSSISYYAPNNWFYKWQWNEDKNFETKKVKEGAVAIFTDGRGIGRQIAKSFDANKNVVYFIEAGKEFNYDGKNNFIINPENEKDYASLLQKLPSQVSTIIHLWNINHYSVEPESLILADKILYETSYSIFNIAQALGTNPNNKIDLVVVTNNAQFIDEKSTSSGPHQSLSTVLAQAIDQDNSNFSTQIIDIDIDEYKSEAQLVEELFNELTKKVNKESIVAIRANKRFVREIAHLDVSRDKLKINHGETYLITGGAGPLGGDIAKELAKEAKVNLILTGRSSLPQRELWEKDLNNASAKERIELILELEKLGANVMYVSVDVTDKNEMTELVHRIHEKFGDIHGVIHGAGVLDYSAFKLLNKDINILKKVFSPKVQGTIVTDLVTRKEPLKFFVMISSVSATKKVWSDGLGDYAAANAFLNAYTYYRKNANAAGKTIALNYSLWDEKGMGSIFGKSAIDAVRAQGLNPLQPQKAVNAFSRALGVNGEHTVHVIDLIEAKPLKGGETEYKAVSSTENEKRTISYLEAKEIKNAVYQVISEQLNVSLNQLDIGMNFLDMGLDSVGAMKSMERLSKVLNVELYPTLIFEYQTPESLANYIESTYFTTESGIEINKAEDKTIKEIVLDEENEDIAIIGISLRIPGANNLEEYWDILKNGKVVVKEVPEERWSIEDEWNANRDSLHTTYSKCGGFIDKPYDFDPFFFGISPNEAEAMDPQQRIFLQVAWEALQQAGYGGKYKTNKIGVFVGCEQNNYMEHFSNYRTYMILKDKLEKSQWFKNIDASERKSLMSTLIDVLKPGELKADAVAGNGLNEVAARVSHCLNLMGPSLIVNTACSSSLVALHLACENLRTKQSEMAVVGGVNLNLSAIPFVCMSKVNAISPTGECRPFDKDANGMILSEGVSAILIKPLKKALKDGDNIYAVIKGSAINNDGRSQGITAPRPQGQAEAVEKAYMNAGINPETVSYVETHGTGTPLGDPIEIEGMTKAFSSFTNKKGYCAIGSVKSSIGHMLAASGLVSLIKVVLAMKHKKIPHTVNYENPNTNINFENTPFYVVSKENMNWESNHGQPLRAGVNAFGFGGTNAHIVIEEPPIRIFNNIPKDEKGTYLLQLTGRNENVIKSLAKELRDYIENNSQITLSSLCVSMNNGQKELAYKSALVVKSKEDLLNLLKSIECGKTEKEVYNGRSNPNRETLSHLLLDGTLVLSSMEVDKLRGRFEAFNNAYGKCLKEYENVKGYNLTSNELHEKINIFSAEYSLGLLLIDLGIKLESIIAKGIGILSAAALTGKISINQAINIIIENINYKNEHRKEANNLYVKCPVVTPIGIIPNDEETLVFIKKALKEDKLCNKCNELIRKNEVLIYLGNSNNILGEISKLGIQGTLIYENITVNSEEAFLIALAKLYVIGVGYNPRSIYPKDIIKSPLPTYPFEYAEYKVSFNDMEALSELSKSIEVDITNNKLLNSEIEKQHIDLVGLVKISSQPMLSKNEKRASYEKLSFDFKLD
ncbi:type I polyketide synthase [Clostridium sp. DJ247]|uniref:type I polyketide synthase n=1 Tax=Clostridium sp. DJ247 TaxID=2726188 RepID=UPI001626F156|nr:type I polyketide synthase [Clostridium sp. DJ247]MBC2578806.1 SDR family NAD(P)-dependent oxidoreductase [Clostridium sp. DJ247]